MLSLLAEHDEKGAASTERRATGLQNGTSPHYQQSQQSGNQQFRCSVRMIAGLCSSVAEFRKDLQDGLHRTRRYVLQISCTGLLLRFELRNQLVLGPLYNVKDTSSTNLRHRARYRSVTEDLLDTVHERYVGCSWQPSCVTGQGTSE